MNRLDQINRAIDYIETHISDHLNVDSIAIESGISRWHFQRVFRAMVGDTVKEYISKRRLYMASRLMRTTERKVIDIALEFNFESHEVFTRAFKRVFKMTPKQFREARPEEILVPKKPKITRAYLSHLYQGLTMEPEIKQIQKMRAAGLTDEFHSALSEKSDTQKIIPALWSRFVSFNKENGLSMDRETIGLINCTRGEGPEAKMEYLAGFVLAEGEEVPDGLTVQEVPSLTYAEFTHKGLISNIHHTMNYIHGSWFPKSDYQMADGPEMEIYPANYNPMSEAAELRVLVPIEK